MIAVYLVCLLPNWRRSKDNLKQGLGVIYFFMFLLNFFLFHCLLHDATVDISAYIWIKLFWTAYPWKEGNNNDDTTFFSVY